MKKSIKNRIDAIREIMIGKVTNLSKTGEKYGFGKGHFRKALFELGYIQKVGKYYDWTGPEPTEDVVQIILKKEYKVFLKAKKGNDDLDTKPEKPKNPPEKPIIPGRSWRIVTDQDDDYKTILAITHLRSLGCSVTLTFNPENHNWPTP